MDDAAVADAFRTYGGAVFRRCRRILRDPEGARDVTQEVFVRCFDRRGRLRHERELLAWLYRVATNLCLNALRDGKLRRDADRRLAPGAPMATEQPEARLLWICCAIWMNGRRRSSSTSTSTPARSACHVQPTGAAVELRAGLQDRRHRAGVGAARTARPPQPRAGAMAISPDGKFITIGDNYGDHGGVTVFSVDDGTTVGFRSFPTETF